MARPTKYSRARSKAICEALRTGNTRKAAAESNGVSKSTFYQWLEEFPDFLDAVTRAEAEAEAAMVQVLKAAAPKDWRAAESWLKRRRPDDWGDKQKLDVRDLTTEQLIALLTGADSPGAEAAGSGVADPGSGA